MGGYGAVERTYHLCRRRRWVRTRKHVAKETKQQAKKVQNHRKQSDGVAIVESNDPVNKTLHRIGAKKFRSWRLGGSFICFCLLVCLLLFWGMVVVFKNAVHILMVRSCPSAKKDKCLSIPLCDINHMKMIHLFVELIVLCQKFKSVPL